MTFIKKIPSLHLCLPLLTVLTWLMMLTGAGLAEEKMLTAHIRHRPPHMIVQGEFLGGSLKELLDLAAQRLAIRVAWRDQPFSKSIEDLKSGNVDIVPRTIQTPEREQWIRFSSPVGYEQQEILFLVRKGQEQAIRNYDDLKTRTIGTKKGTAYFPRFDKDQELAKRPHAGDDYGLLDQFVTGAVDTVIVLDRRAMESALAGLGVTDYAFAQYRMVMSIAMNYGFSKSSPNAVLTEALERELQALTANGEAEAVLTRFFQNERAADLATRLSTDDRQWLEDNPAPFRVGFTSDRPPFHFRDGTQPRGFAIDYLDLLASKLAIPIRHASGQEDADLVLDPPAGSVGAGDVVFTPPYPGSTTGIALPKSMVRLRDLLQKAMGEITPQEMKRLEEKWPNAIPATSGKPADALQLTNEEEAWVKQHPRIRVGVVTANPPFEFFQNGKFTGMSADFANLLASQSGLALTAVPFGSGTEASAALASGKIDLLPAVMTGEKPLASLLLTEPYLTFPVMIVTHRDGAFVGGLEDLTESKVAVIEEDTLEGDLVRRHARTQPLVMATLGDALQALDQRKIDAVVDNLASATYEMQRLSLDKLRLAAPTPHQVALAMAVRQDWPELRSILQKGIKRIANRDRTAILNAWMAVQVQIGIEMKHLLLWIVPIGLAVVLIVVAIMVWNRRLGREIRERKQAETALEAAEERSRLLLESVGEGIFGLDVEGRINFFNPAGAAMLNRQPEELIGQEVCILINHHDHDKSGCLKEKCPLRKEFVQERQVHRADERFWRKDAGLFSVEFSSHPIWKEQQLIGSVVVFRDITERLLIEQKIRILSSAVEQSPVSIVITDPKARIEYVNPAFTRVSGYSAEEVMGKNPRILRSGSLEAGFYQSLWQTLLTGETWEGELLNRTKSGQLYWEATTISPIRDPDGKVRHYLANKEDITRRKQAEERLQEALKLISSSIHYASRIQRSILVPPQMLTEVLPEHFVLWEPRDVVGGDMYWYRPWITGTLLALGDCTGHGVPGAFITLIANGALDQALLETPPGDTATLLQRMHQLIQLALGQDREEGASNDGLELGVCYLDPELTNLTYSGARFSLFVVSEEACQEIKGDKLGIGYRDFPRDIRFTAQEVALRQEWCYYMTSDGLIDQLGGESRRAFGKQRFVKLLDSLRQTPIAEHGEHIKQALLAYQNNEHRRDDVSVVGFKGIIN